MTSKTLWGSKCATMPLQPVSLPRSVLSLLCLACTTISSDAFTLLPPDMLLFRVRYLGPPPPHTHLFRCCYLIFSDVRLSPPHQIPFIRCFYLQFSCLPPPNPPSFVALCLLVYWTSPPPNHPLAATFCSLGPPPPQTPSFRCSYLPCL